VGTGGALKNVENVGGLLAVGLMNSFKNYSVQLNYMLEAGITYTHGDAISLGGQSGTGIIYHLQGAASISVKGDVDGKGTYSVGLAPFLNYETDFFKGGAGNSSATVWTGGINLSFGFRSAY
jgi:hypothetical protein